MDSSPSKCMTGSTSSAIMRACSSESLQFQFSDDSPSKMASNETALHSIDLRKYVESVCLVDAEEELAVKSFNEFINKLNLNTDSEMRVLSIFGSPGDGKSYFLNNFMFNRREIFKTSSNPAEGTRGVWASYDVKDKLLCLDTQPVQSLSSNVLLFKILAISDVAIYRTRSERLPEDLYKFLGQASDAIIKHFKDVLKQSGHIIEFEGAVCTQGPAIFICHEPLHSSPLKNMDYKGRTLTAEEQIKKKIVELNYDIRGLGKIHYIPIQSPFDNSFQTLSSELNSFLNNLSFRSARRPTAIFKSLKALSNRFKGQLTCQMSCEACQAKCQLTVGHEKDSIDHSSEEKCRYSQQYKNKESVCSKCHSKVKSITDDSNTWYSYFSGSHYKLECPKCGEIYASKGNWFGNQEEESSMVYPKFVHIWPGLYSNFNDSASVGMRRALEGVDSFFKKVYVFSTDYVAPDYWQPNSEITNCYVCKGKINITAGNVHHCRMCGKGVCNKCSSQPYIPVPTRGWNDPVRVCDVCRETKLEDIPNKTDNLTSRIVTEKVVNTLKPLKQILNYPKDVITNYARPTYWTPDEETSSCAVCDKIFGSEPHNSRHHCRRCGKSVCEDCSPHREPVPERGWYSPSRVCEKCKDSIEFDKKRIEELDKVL